MEGQGMQGWFRGKGWYWKGAWLDKGLRWQVWAWKLKNYLKFTCVLHQAKIEGANTYYFFSIQHANCLVLVFGLDIYHNK